MKKAHGPDGASAPPLIPADQKLTSGAPAAPSVQTLGGLPPSGGSPGPSITSTAAPAPSGQPAPLIPQPVTAGVSNKETIAGQLHSILNEDSPLLQNARTRAVEFASSRGLQNSTLAAGSGERALIETALPVAQGDASANFQRTSQNLATQNQFGLQEKGIQGQLRLGAMPLSHKLSQLQQHRVSFYCCF